MYFKGTEEVSATFEGNKQTKKMLGNMEPRKTSFRFLENKQVYFSLPPPPPPREALDGLWIIHPRYRHNHIVPSDIG